MSFNPLSLLGLGSLFGAKHAKAVAVENQTLDSARPVANQRLDAIERAVNAAEITRSEAAEYVQGTLAEFADATAHIRKKDGAAMAAADSAVSEAECEAASKAGGKCNAACVILCKLRVRGEQIIARAPLLASPAEGSGVGGVVESAGRALGLSHAVPTQQADGNVILENRLTGMGMAAAVAVPALVLVALVVTLTRRRAAVPA